MKQILVTGGAGFIGSNLCIFLLEQGHFVTCVDNFYSSQESNIKGLMIHSNFKFINHNIVEPLDIEDRFDEIYHLACPASPKQYQKDPIFTLDTNYLGTKNILNFALKTGSRVLLSSTSEVYGDPLVHPQSESYWGNVNPNGIRSCYDEGKRIAETLMMDYHRTYGIPIRIARIFNTYGPKMEKDDGRVVSNFIYQALQNDPLTIYGAGTQTRSFCYISDMVEGLVLLMESENLMVGPINLGDDNECSISELAYMIIQLTSSESKVTFLPLPNDDPKLRQPNIEKALQLLQWFPKTNLTIGLGKTIKYFVDLERKD